MKVLALVLALVLARAAPAQDAATAPPPLQLEHRELVRRLRSRVRDGAIHYTGDRVVLDGKVQVWPAWFRIHVEATFARAGGRVRLHVEELLVSGRGMPGRRGDAEARLARLVDVESEAVRVLVRDGELEHGFDVAP